MKTANSKSFAELRNSYNFVTDLLNNLPNYLSAHNSPTIATFFDLRLLSTEANCHVSATLQWQAATGA